MLYAFIFFLLQFNPGQKIITAFGPEDVAIHPSKEHIIIISCDNRIKGMNEEGKIQYYDTHQSYNKAKDFTYKNYNSNNLRPHGIYAKTHNGKDLLYVISHEVQDRIIIFSIIDSSLYYLNHFEGVLLDRPNDLYVDQQGNIIFTNTHNYIQGFFNFHKASIGVIYSDETMELIEKKRRGANGIIQYNDDLIFTDDLDDGLYAIKDYFVNPRKELKANSILRLSVGDNINSYKDQLLITNHPSLFRFFFS